MVATVWNGLSLRRPARLLHARTHAHGPSFSPLHGHTTINAVNEVHSRGHAADTGSRVSRLDFGISGGFSAGTPAPSHTARTCTFASPRKKNKSEKQDKCVGMLSFVYEVDCPPPQPPNLSAPLKTIQQPFKSGEEGDAAFNTQLARRRFNPA